MKIGSDYKGNGACDFAVWGPLCKSISLEIVHPQKKSVPMEMDDRGYWTAGVQGIFPGFRYFYRLDAERERPDPASHFQPEGVHGPSQIVDQNAFAWSDEQWKGIPLSDMIIYEIHVGTFTPEGTFDAVIPRLDELKDLGVNALEIMPVAQFPGERNWGYDGACLFAVQNSYGGPDGLKKLVDACHVKGIAVVLDVVYNHLGPEGNYLREFGPYFTDKHRTPWGQAINFDDAFSDDVRNFFIENAHHWFRDFHADALRLDAVHSIFDANSKTFLQELAEKTELFSSEKGRKYYLIAESDSNDVRLIRPGALGGYGMDAQWNDDMHHSIHALLTGERRGYYADFGEVGHLVKALREGFVYSWDYSVYRKRHHGSSSADRPAEQFVVSIQNHDQTGNRMLGERLKALVSFEKLKLAAAVLFVSPYIPLLFMGEEYGEDNPFLYFVSHGDADLVKAVREGRRNEFRAFDWKGELPDPQSVETFLGSRIEWEKRNDGNYAVLLKFYKTLIQLRRTIPALSNLDKGNLDVSLAGNEKVIFMNRWKDRSNILGIFNFHEGDKDMIFELPGGKWKKIMDSSDEIWAGPGKSMPETAQNGDVVSMRASGVVLYSREEN
ncbi:MAG: malto-oligosyltrehalose trehalohydrolase [Nitrospirota bacterium]|nr:malto-oligosyltrehalose trehalohydrolase [Nitrospirota bacterium]